MIRAYACLVVMLLVPGCEPQDAGSPEQRVMIDTSHSHYHVHGHGVDHGHTHTDFVAGGHVHEHGGHER